MDPKATLERAASAIEDGDLDEAQDAIDDYARWRRKGGFQPSGGDAKLRRLRDDLRRARMQDNPRGDGREHEPDLGELIEALELYNDNTDSRTVPAGGEKIYVFVWPPEGGRDGEWQILSHVNAKKHQAEYGGKFAEVRILGHEGGFNAFRAAVDALRTLGIKATNPDEERPKYAVRSRLVGGRHWWTEDSFSTLGAARHAKARMEEEKPYTEKGEAIEYAIFLGGVQESPPVDNPEGPPPGVPALPTSPKKNPNPDYKWFVTDGETIYSGWEFKSDAEDDLAENGDFYEESGHAPVSVTSRRSLIVDPDDGRSWFGHRVPPTKPLGRGERGRSGPIKKNPSHADLERAARTGKMTPDVAAWAKQYPQTWNNLKKRTR